MNSAPRSQPNSSADEAREQLIDAAIGEYLAAVERGEDAGAARAIVAARYPQVTAELAEFLANDSRLKGLLGPSRPLAGAAAGVLAPGTDFGEYRIVDIIARGGMGVVYRAFHKTLEREVALKTLLPLVLGEPSAIARFEREARAAAGLRHPGIVTIYQVGVHDGVHYYTMELIDGGSLAEHRDRFNQDPRAAAQCVETVARAVHFAHLKGVLHRDLKPGNLLIDRNGEPRVTDFGLARALEDRENLTLTGALVGTPAYMAPEQTQGGADRFMPAADIYSLGVILYELTTGAPPFRHESSLELLRLVRDTPPKPPRSARPTLPLDLETIVLKCLEKRPQQRYSSAAALADDLQRFLAGHPIEARRITRLARTIRWCRRNPALTTILALLAIIAGVANYHRVILAGKNTELIATNAALETANLRETNAARIAQEQSHTALEVLSYLINEVQTQLKAVPGTAALRRSLLRTAHARLHGMSDKFLSRVAIDRQSFSALTQLGVMFMFFFGADSELSEESEFADLILSTDEIASTIDVARIALEQAFAIASRSSAADPENPFLLRDLSVAHLHLGTFTNHCGDFARAAEHYQQGLELAERLVTLDPESADYRNVAALLGGHVGRVHERLGNSELAREHLKKAIEHAKRHVELAAGDVDTIVSLAHILHRYGDYWLKDGDLKQAESSYDECLKLLGAVGEDARAAPDLQHELLYACVGTARVALRTDRTTKALEYAERAESTARRLMAQEQENMRAHGDLIYALETSGDVLRRLGNHELAFAKYEEGMRLQESLSAGAPENESMLASKAVMAGKLGETAEQLGREAEALEYSAKALSLRERLAHANPENLDMQRRLGLALRRVGLMKLNIGEEIDGIALLERSRDVTRALTERNPMSAPFARELSISTEVLGLEQWSRGELASALASLVSVVATRRRLLERDPASAQAARDLSVGLVNLADIALESRDLALARTSVTESLEIRLRSAEKDSANAQARRDLMVARSKLGQVEQVRGDLPAALEQLRAAVELAATLNAATDITTRRAVAEVRGRLGTALVLSGQPHESLALLQEAREMWQQICLDLRAPEFVRQLGLVSGQLAHALVESKRGGEAREFFQRQVELLRESTATTKSGSRELKEFAAACVSLADFDYGTGNFESALASAREAETVARRLVADRTDDAPAQGLLASCLLRRGRAAGALDDHETAALAYRGCLAIEDDWPGLVSDTEFAAVFTAAREELERLGLRSRP
ncbi:MAG: protein kinase domain-containing protein [Planctomycetota bacterium]